MLYFQRISVHLFGEKIGWIGFSVKKERTENIFVCDLFAVCASIQVVIWNNFRLPAQVKELPPPEQVLNTIGSYEL